MSYETIRYAVEDAVATITLNRPEKLNAYVPQMGDELVAAFRAARDDDAVRAVILTGAGRGFCAGVDLDALKAQQSGASEGGGSRLGQEEFINQFPLELAAFPKPVIVAINGAAIGVGITMSLPCDIRIAAEGVKLGITFAKLGILPGLGSTHLLPKLIGLANALDLTLTARVIRAEEARDLGLVSRVVPADRLMEEARAVAGQVAECQPAALAGAKRALHFGAGATMEEAIRNEKAEGEALRKARG